jgi:hypothetical protein
MNKVEELAKPGNPFDDGSRINQNYFKIMRDLIVDLDSRVKELENRLGKAPKSVEGEIGYVEPPTAKKAKK